MEPTNVMLNPRKNRSGEWKEKTQIHRDTRTKLEPFKASISTLKCYSATRYITLTFSEGLYDLTSELCNTLAAANN